ncbi:MAG: CBS domain-containing protein [Actinomycetota bacterium]|nr:CBS domain-containing protein [Actinomycetota bacterium]
MANISEVMTRDVVSFPSSATVVEAALGMRGADIGFVVMTVEDQPRGVITDRDIVIRVVAEGLDPSETTLGEIASGEVACLTPEHTAEDAARLMRQLAVRRIPVVDDSDRLVGVVSIGDLAVEKDPESALADISASPPNR